MVTTDIFSRVFDCSTHNAYFAHDNGVRSVYSLGMPVSDNGDILTPAVRFPAPPEEARMKAVLYDAATNYRIAEIPTPEAAQARC
jgi:hypothetical protein